MKRFYFFILMCFVGFLSPLNSQVPLIIGSGDTNSGTLPIEEYFHFSLSQQIYTAEEMYVSSGTITDVAFKMVSGSPTVRNVNLFMINTDKEFFQNGEDWVQLSAADIVYSGEIVYNDVPGEWFNIELQTPFEYTGGNVLVCMQDITGTSVPYADDARFATYSVGSSPRSIYAASIQYIYSPMDLENVYGYFQGSNPYYNNQIRFMVTMEGANNPIVVTPNPINMGNRPVGAWMEPYDITIESNFASVNITSIESSDDFFNLSDIDTPYELNFGEPLNISVTHGNASGNVNAQLTISLEGLGDTIIDMTAFAYTPQSSDVWETAESVNSYPYLSTPQFSNLYDNYNLPFGEQDGPDAVFELNFTTDKLLTATATGSNAKVVLYEEGFNGKEGPSTDNYYSLQNAAAINGMYIPAGKYYLVASASQSFMLYVDATDAPLPDAAFNPVPADMSTDVDNPVLSWEFSANTTEYQLLLDTQNPPQNVAVDWTSDLQNSYTINELLNNTCYYWQLNVRNTTGTTSGDVWSFTTPFDIPQNVSVSDAQLYEGEALNVSWSPVQRSHIGYNIYVDGEKHNTAAVTSTSYTIEDLSYNMNGYDISVSAVYDEGESDLSSSVRVYVSGKNTVAGTVFEIDGETPVEQGQLLFSGKDQFGIEHEYTVALNNGAYSAEVYVGEYIVEINSEGYQDYSEEITVSYGNTINFDFILYETYYPVSYVEAADMQNGTVKVEWGMDKVKGGSMQNVFATDKNREEVAEDKSDRALASYNIYRSNFYNNEVEYLGNTTETTYTDSEWQSLETGVYQWGVSAVYEGNRSSQTVFEEDFECGNIPEGWTGYSDPAADSDMSYWHVAESEHGFSACEGDYAAFSRGSSANSSFYFVTPAIDLSTCFNKKLSFHYISPEWGGDQNVLWVKLASSPTGPWTEIWTSGENNVSTWTDVEIDISGFSYKETYIAFVNENHYGYCVGIDNVSVINESNESEIVWSDAIDGNMNTVVEINVETNSGDPATGTVVSFVNMLEQGFDYEVVLDETGSYTWDFFRKGQYQLTITKQGYDSDIIEEIVEVWEPTELSYVLEELLLPIENLYVSPTGFVMWSAPSDSKELLSYGIKLDGLFVEETSVPYYQYDMDSHAFNEGEVYTTAVTANYTTGSSETVKYSWTFAECDNYEGAGSFTVENVDGKNILNWSIPEVEYDLNHEGEWMFYDDGVNIDGVGRYYGDTFYWAIMLPSETVKPYVGQKLIKVSTYDYAAHDGYLMIYKGGDNYPSTLVHSQMYTCHGTNQYVDFELTEKILVGAENIWIVFHNINGQYVGPAGANTGDHNGRWISVDGVEWLDMFEDVGYDYTWNIRAFVDYYGEYIDMEKGIIGTQIYRNGELIAVQNSDQETYTDESEQDAHYCIKLIHGGLPNSSYYAMSCLQCDDTSVDENDIETFAIYPNPAKSVVNISAKSMKHITVMNAVGQVVYDSDVDSDEEIVDMSQYGEGVYLIRVLTDDGITTGRFSVIR